MSVAKLAKRLRLVARIYQRHWPFNCDAWPFIPQRSSTSQANEETFFLIKVVPTRQTEDPEDFDFLALYGRLFTKKGENWRFFSEIGSENPYCTTKMNRFSESDPHGEIEEEDATRAESGYSSDEDEETGEKRNEEAGQADRNKCRKRRSYSAPPTVRDDWESHEELMRELYRGGHMPWQQR